MCGISVVVAAKAENGKSTTGRERLTEQMQASLENIKHRGPDSHGIWISSDERIGSHTPSQLLSRPVAQVFSDHRIMTDHSADAQFWDIIVSP